ncbi:unnamed protein product [Soboliphyme baturini]|uniref:Uncharacterized protein n=1 Tax=Soboliphyme baturini TaxID=241478 RepID=A0A183J3G9_9BILA|nr:unnamed protein product [Soboliphyme baturini]
MPWTAANREMGSYDNRFVMYPSRRHSPGLHGHSPYHRNCLQPMPGTLNPLLSRFGEQEVLRAFNGPRPRLFQCDQQSSIFVLDCRSVPFAEFSSAAYGFELEEEISWNAKQAEGDEEKTAKKKKWGRKNEENRKKNQTEQKTHSDPGLHASAGIRGAEVAVTSVPVAGSSQPCTPPTPSPPQNESSSTSGSPSCETYSSYYPSLQNKSGNFQRKQYPDLEQYWISARSTLGSYCFGDGRARRVFSSKPPRVKPTRFKPQNLAVAPSKPLLQYL